MINYILLTFGYLSGFFIVGFVFIELFFPELTFRIKFPLYFLTSILISTYLMYIVALIFGFTRTTVLVTFLAIMPVFILKFIGKSKSFNEYIKNHYKILLLSFLVFLVYLIALTPAILSLHDNYYVMSGSNWQDTALHLGITESLTQGNFPPKAPYYSGQPLTYYYFSDFHSAIIAILSTDFYPKIFVVSNSILASILCLSIYSLAFEITKNKKISIQSSFLGTFFSGYLSVKFLNGIYLGGKALELLANKSYSMEYNNIFGMSNLADYFLQNRPMMVGLSAVIIIILLCIYSFRKENLKTLLLAGVLCACLVKFQFFCVIAAGIALFILSVPVLVKRRFYFVFKSYLLFSVPILMFYFVFGTRSVNGTSFFDLVKNTFRFGVWDPAKSTAWHVQFVLLNLGLPFLITLWALFKNPKKAIKLLSALALLFVAIPYLVSFTIAEGDMLKFFYFAVILFSIISINFLHSVIKNKIALYLTVLVFIFTSTLSSFLTLGNSFLNKNSGYSVDAYNAGLWIRDNTPQRSVFVTMPTVHSSPVDIGGRLRIISYINWPYSHGFNIGTDNVFVRVSDVEDVYKNDSIEFIKIKYNANYIYLGDEEESEFPEAAKMFDGNGMLKRIYAEGDIKIYEIL